MRNVGVCSRFMTGHKIAEVEVGAYLNTVERSGEGLLTIVVEAAEYATSEAMQAGL